MLSIRPKIISPIVSLYLRPLHPELFQIVADNIIKYGDYELRLQITNAGHVISWTDGTNTLSEVVSPSSAELPPSPTFRKVIRREKTNQSEFDNNSDSRLRYKSEQHIDNIAPETLKVIDWNIRNTTEQQGLAYKFDNSGRTNYGAVSYIATQLRQTQLSIQAIHTFPDDMVLLRSETRITAVGK